MDLDLNSEVVVEGDDQAFNDFQDLLEVDQEHVHEHVPDEELPVVIDLNALTSMDYVSSSKASGPDEHLSEAQVAAKEAHIVLALQGALVNFSVEEIQLHELLSANPSEGSGSSEAGQSSARNNNARVLENMQVGMVVLLDNLDVDPRLQSLVFHMPLIGKKSVDGRYPDP
jgi:hypothetical protein